MSKSDLYIGGIKTQVNGPCLDVLTLATEYQLSGFSNVCVLSPQPVDSWLYCQHGHHQRFSTMIQCPSSLHRNSFNMINWDQTEFQVYETMDSAKLFPTYKGFDLKVLTCKCNKHVEGQCKVVHYKNQNVLTSSLSIVSILSWIIITYNTISITVIWGLDI